jgi:hypothetical protein
LDQLCWGEYQHFAVVEKFTAAEVLDHFGVLRT